MKRIRKTRKQLKEQVVKLLTGEEKEAVSDTITFIDVTTGERFTIKMPKDEE
jgi:hypothetical protein